MGYTAELHHSDAPIVIPAHRIEAVLDELAKAEDRPDDDWRSGDHDRHLSWCRPIATYTGTPIERLTAILAAYGFTQCIEVVQPTGPNAYNVALEVHSWGGDKIGSDWGAFWCALGHHAATPTTWTMQGEDGHMWAQCIDGRGNVDEYTVTLTVDQTGKR